jgi:hypothetical protein
VDRKEDGGKKMASYTESLLSCDSDTDSCFTEKYEEKAAEIRLRYAALLIQRWWRDRVDEEGPSLQDEIDYEEYRQGMRLWLHEEEDEYQQWLTSN